MLLQGLILYFEPLHGSFVQYMPLQWPLIHHILLKGLFVYQMFLQGPFVYHVYLQGYQFSFVFSYFGELYLWIQLVSHSSSVFWIHFLYVLQGPQSLLEQAFTAGICDFVTFFASTNASSN